MGRIYYNAGVILLLWKGRL